MFFEDLFYLCEHGYACLPHFAGASGGQKKVSVSLVLELQEVIRYSLWVLGTKLQSSRVTTNNINC